jgi:hypothetical protein
MRAGGLGHRLGSAPDWPTEDGMGVRLKILEGKWERAGPFGLFVEGGVRRAMRYEEGQHGQAVRMADRWGFRAVNSSHGGCGLATWT